MSINNLSKEYGFADNPTKKAVWRDSKKLFKKIKTLGCKRRKSSFCNLEPIKPIYTEKKCADKFVVTFNCGDELPIEFTLTPRFNRVSPSDNDDLDLDA